ncbi:MAG TPA: class I SAM-dependent methyltransferase [Actinocatenispora sp.]
MGDAESTSVPETVRRRMARARALGFGYSCKPPVGQLLATLAAAVPTGGRVLELGTGAGVGTAWIASGVGARTDVTVQTVESDGDLAAEVAGGGLPAWIEVITGDAETLLPRLGQFDLVFADAVGDKWTGLHHT